MSNSNMQVLSVPRDALKFLKCAVCTNYLSYFPICLASDGSSICGRCVSILPDGEFIPNAPFESLAQTLKFPCIYEVEGCLEYMFPKDVPSHEANCPHKIIPCPTDCLWLGTNKELLQHFQDLHPTLILSEGEFEMDFTESYEKFYLFPHQDELFSVKKNYNFELNILSISLLCYGINSSSLSYNYEVLTQNLQHTKAVLFPCKSAMDFRDKNITKISVEDVKKKLSNPSVILGTIKIIPERAPYLSSEALSPILNPQVNYDLLAELECPICFEYIIPPIYQCMTGHSICSMCKDQVSECPTCKCEIKNTQNFTAEKMAQLLLYPCKFSDNGCTFASHPHKIQDHQKYCVHKSHECPLNDYEECPWKGPFDSIISHIFHDHHDNILEIDSITVLVDEEYLQGTESMCYILKLSGKIFKLHYLFQNKRFFWSMQLLGLPEESVQFKFEIDVVDKSDKNQRLFLRKFCAPWSDKDRSFEDNENFIFINYKQIKSFISEDCVTFRVRILN